MASPPGCGWLRPAGNQRGGLSLIGRERTFWAWGREAATLGLQGKDESSLERGGNVRGRHGEMYCQLRS